MLHVQPPMHWPRVRWLAWPSLGAVALGLSLVSGCGTDQPFTPTQPVGSATLAGTTPDGASRFDIQLNARGSFKPGQPVNVSVVVTANMQSTGTSIRLYAPEAEAATRHGWGDDFRLDVNQPIRAFAEDRASMAAGDKRTATGTLMFNAPGMYSVIAVASSDSDARSSHVQDLAREEIWIAVTQDGGSVFTSYTPAAIPDSVQKQPGPFRKRVYTTPPLPRGTVTTKAYGDPDTYQVVAILDSIGDPVPRPVADAMTEWYVYGYREYDIVEVRGHYFGTTGPDGSITVSCPNDDEWIEGRVYLKNAYSYYDRWADGVAGFGRPGDRCGGGGVTQIQSTNAAATRIFVSLDSAGIRSQQLFGRTRSAVKFRHCENNGCEPTGYLPSSDQIDFNHNAVWNNYGIYAQYHEYGHSFLNKALGGYTPPGGCNPHGRGVQTNLNCAWVEGFGDFFAELMGSQYRTRSLVTYATPDASKDEGYVEAYIWDVTDGVDSVDPVQIDVASLGNVIYSCKVYNTETTVRWVTGVDDLIQCLENRTLGSLYDTHFVSRIASARPWGIVVSGNPPIGGTWSPDLNRVLWKKVLYNE